MPLKIILLECKALDADRIEATLLSGGIDCKLHWVATRSAFVNALKLDRFDLILADYYTLPNVDEASALAIARKWCPDLPFIFVSGSLGEELAVEAIKQGATDYVLKQRLERLVPCVQRALREAQERREREAQLATELSALVRLNEVSSRLWRKLSLSEGLNEMLIAIIKLLDADMGNIQLFDAEREVLYTAVQQGFKPDFLDIFREVSTEDNSACGRTLRTGQRTIIEDVEVDALYTPLRSIARAAGYRAMQSTPLMGRDDTLLGMISTHWRSPHQPSEQDLRRLDLYVRQAADFIESIRGETAIRESEQKYRSLFEWIDQGFCLLEVLFDANDKAIDYRFIEINEAFEQQSGLVNAVGKTILELVPNFEPQWAEFYGQVAKSGEAVRFEADVPSMNRVFDAYAFPSGAPGQNLVAVLFADITDRKRAEEILRRTAELDAFRVSLADALRLLTDASEIQAIAARILGESLRATRVIYIEVVSDGEEVIVHRNYTNGVAELSGQYRLEDYRRNLTADHQAGHTQIVTDIPDNPRYTDAEKVRYRELDIAAHIDVPLIKNNQFVALLAVHQSTPRQWTETEVKLVEETAERTWAAVERARAESALHKNEEMLRLALTGARAGTWDWDLTTGYLIWSPQTYRLYGLDLGAGLPQYEGWYENLLHPDDRDRVSAYVSQVLAQKIREFQLEFRILHPQHGIRWLLSRGCLTCNASGEAMRLSGINLDITDRKLAEQKIREQAALLDITSDAIFVRDLKHRILYWNQGAEQLYGWQAREAIGQIAYQLLEANADQIQEIMPMLLIQGEWRGEMHKTTKTGKAVIVEARWTLMRDEANQPKCILSVDTDITEKKQLEAQFYRAQRLESLGTLASGIAHDLNNVLTPILAISQLLRLHQPNLNARSQEMLKLLEDSAKRGTNLIKQILTFTRGTGGECHPINVVSLLQEVCSIVQQSFPKAINIRQTIPDQGDWFVAADSTYLHQVLMNLCVNARDAMPNGGVLSLSVEYCFVDQAFAQTNLGAQIGKYVVITIADTGVGIPPEVRDRIFDPFFTTKLLGQGTGLGLATVLGIVKEYGGFLQVFSEVDLGTQMKVYLPTIETTPTSSEQLEKQLDGNGEQVLIVDDDVAVQLSTQSLLESHHYTVLSSNDGMEAIALYTQHQNDIKLVILDIMMPTMSGITLIQELRGINPTVKIIAMSGLPVNREPALAAGANAFLLKPYPLEKLLENLQTLIAI